MLLTYTHTHWQSFVNAEFGTGGRQEHHERFAKWIVSLVLGGPLLMVSVKLKMQSKGMSDELSWKEAAMILIPSGFGLILLLLIIVR